MKKMESGELGKFKSEFEMVCAAQDGDDAAWLGLWAHYKGVMMSRLSATRGMTREELESEAVEVFATKLANFDRAKVRDAEAFSMFAWVFCAAINRTNKVIRRSKRDIHLYFKEAACDGRCAADGDDDGREIGERIIGVDESIYTRYAPERLVFEEARDDDSERVREFYARLSDFDKDILEARRQGLTLAQTAGRLRCSVTTVKHHIKCAKDIAFDVFGVRCA